MKLLHVVSVSPCWSNIFALSHLCICDHIDTYKWSVSIWMYLCIYIDVSRVVCVYEFTTKFILSTTEICARAVCRFLSRFHDVSFYYHHCVVDEATITYTTIKHAMLSAWSTPKYVYTQSWCWVIHLVPCTGRARFFLCMYGGCMYKMSYVQNSGEHTNWTELNSTQLNSTEQFPWHV